MQIRRHQESGSLLITAAISAAIISILIGGMLTFLTNEYTLEVRAHRWNQALNLGEAGVEMAFAEFNNYYITGADGFSTTRGWSAHSGGTYVKTAAFTNGANEFVGSVYSSVNGVGTANPYLFAYGSCGTIPGGPVIYRGIEARLRLNGRFPAGMVAKEKIDMNGNNVMTDSYDSSSVWKSTDGQYVSGKRQANGDIASNETVTNTVDVLLGNADIYGQVLLGPSGSVTMGSNGSIGPTLVEANRADTVAEAQTAGWVRNDFQVDIPDVDLPAGATSWTALPSAAAITDGDYKGTDITSSRTISGNVRIYLTSTSSSIKLTGSDEITLLPGARLIIYAAGDVDIAGNGVINTNTWSPPVRCQVYGLPTCDSVKLAGNAEFVGCVYAPQAALEIKGGGSSGSACGAVVARSIKMTGVTNFHYDENLRNNGPNSSYDISSWKSWRWTGGAWAGD